jgi:DNA-binding transcriptional ArsR family regulator
MDVFPMSDKMLDLVAGRFRTLGAPYRLRILQVLTRGAMRVGDLVEELHGNQPNVSKHLQILHQAGIVGRRREGNGTVYSLNDPTIFRLCELVHRNESRKSEAASGHIKTRSCSAS